jgi:hypothetical protein
LLLRNLGYRAFVFLLFLWSVWAVTSFAGCSWSDENIPPASILASGRVTLSWNEAPGAISYNIYLSTSPGVTKLRGYKIRDATNPITITDLEPGATYYFIVTMVNELKDRGFGWGYEKVAEQTGALLIPNIFEGIMGNRKLMSDPIHPNKAGYTIIAQRFYKAKEF